METNNKQQMKPQGQMPMQTQEPQQVIVEREITLGLINEKLNIILNILSQETQPIEKK